MNIEELLTKLPSNWNEISIWQFQTLTECAITDDNDGLDGIQNSLEVISKLTGEHLDVLEQLPMSQINQLGNKLSFMVNPPELTKDTLLKWKTLDEITFNDYITFLQVQKEPMKNLALIVKTFTKSDFTEADILAMPVTEFNSGFFLFSKESNQYLKRLIRSTKWKVVKLTMKEKLKGWLGRIKK